MTNRFVIATVLAVCSCNVGEEILSYEEFAAQAYEDPESGMRFIDGDTPIADDDDMLLHYESYVASFSEPAEPAERGAIEAGLIVGEKAGRLQKWTRAEARDLRYCVDRVGFGGSYDEMVGAMAAAAADWESAANVDFIHDPSQDANCSSQTTGVVFNVSLVCGRNFWGSAFFPDNPRKKRQVKIDCEAFVPGAMAPDTLVGLVRHELGHALGFRHEHIRPQAGKCREGGHYKTLTGYDAKSVMHYPECNGKNRGESVLTDKDRRGARELYPF